MREGAEDRVVKKTLWSDAMVLESVRDHQFLTPQAEARALALADAGLIDTAGSWKLTARGRRALRRLIGVPSNGLAVDANGRPIK